jgi:hypothetical protein
LVTVTGDYRQDGDELTDPAQYLALEPTLKSIRLQVNDRPPAPGDLAKAGRMNPASR